MLWHSNGYSIVLYTHMLTQACTGRFPGTAQQKLNIHNTTVYTNVVGVCWYFIITHCIQSKHVFPVGSLTNAHHLRLPGKQMAGSWLQLLQKSIANNHD